LWVDDTLVIDGWQDGSVRLIQAEQTISAGAHRIIVEYYERGGGAQVAVNWARKQEVGNQPPQAVPGGPYIVDEGSWVAFDGGKSKDPDGRIVQYEWDFNYDGRTFIADANGQTVSHSYPDGPATIVVALRVTDNKDASQLGTAQVQVRNVAPVVEAGGPYTGPVDSLIVIAGTAADPGSIDQTGLVYAWDFGDGARGSGPMVSHSYPQPGDYVLRLTVSDKDGGQGSDTATVRVTAVNQAPLAVVSAPSQGLVGEMLDLSGDASNDGDGYITSYAWDFGDGMTGVGVNVTHSYSAAGSYQVILTVTDNAGLTASAPHTIQIEFPAPLNLPPVAVISGPGTSLVGEAVLFDGSGSHDSGGGIVDYIWDFGDGDTGDGIAVDHTYPQAGVYQVTLTVRDEGGLTTNATHTIQIEMTSTNAIGRQLPQ
jgi:PKD repeat protein